MATEVKQQTDETKDEESNLIYKHNITINIGNEKWARILVNSISVDKEVNPDNFQRQIIQQNERIIVNFSASKWKWLRVGIQSFYDNIQLCLQTIQTFENYQ